MNAQLELGKALEASCLDLNASQFGHLSGNDHLARRVGSLLFKREIVDGMLGQISNPAFNSQERVGVEGMTRDCMGVSCEWARDEQAPAMAVGRALVWPGLHGSWLHVLTGVLGPQL